MATTAENPALRRRCAPKHSGVAALRSTQSLERFALLGVILLSVVISIAYAIVVPWGEAPDEPAHERYVEYVVRFGTLPPITGDHPYTNESQQPPLYYVLGAAAVWARRIVPGSEPMNNPLNANVGPARKIIYSVLTHDPHNRFPFYGYLLRGLSILMGVGTVFLTYLTARRLVPPPAPPTVALLAAFFVALQPERLFIGSSVTNENLETLISAWLSFLICSILTTGKSDASRLTRYASTAGLALGLGLLTKYTIGTFALPLVWSLWVARRSDWRGALGDAARMIGIAALLSGGFFLYNILTYGDPFASRAVAAMLPTDSQYKLTDLYWLRDPFRWFLWSSYWGVFGWQLIWMPDWFYDIFGVLTGVGIVGGAYLILTRALNVGQRLVCAAFLGQALIMYAVVVLYSLRLIAWQGRELFPALPGLCVLLGLGIAGLAQGTAALAPTAEAESSSSTPQRAGWATALALLALLLFTNVAALVKLNDVFWH